jgi:ABC-type oligopeptide transport system ATPase subunit
MAPGATILEARDLSVWFPARHRLFRKRQWIRAVDGVSLQVMPGETLGVVGESGCGKTTLGRALVMLHRPTGGEVTFAGRALTALRGKKLRGARRYIQMIFQDPYASLDPRQPVEDIVGEPLRIAGVAAASRRKRVAELLELVQLGAESARRLPREFSGGQRQRIGIARALAADPRLIICDEPLSALDLSVQAQILNLLKALQRETGIGYLFITHDLAVVPHIAHRVVVLYRGQVVETGTVNQVCEHPSHPYTQRLISAAPVPDPEQQRVRRRTVEST